MKSTKQRILDMAAKDMYATVMWIPSEIQEVARIHGRPTMSWSKAEAWLEGNGEELAGVMLKAAADWLDKHFERTSRKAKKARLT
jgi:hypothetical protein